MSDVNVLVGTIRKKIVALLSTLQQLKSENEKLRSERVELLQSIDNQNKIINDFKNLERSKIIAKSLNQGEENRDVKIQIDKMVREIDKCIELLDK